MVVLIILNNMNMTQAGLSSRLKLHLFGYRFNMLIGPITNELQYYPPCFGNGVLQTTQTTIPLNLAKLNSTWLSQLSTYSCRASWVNLTEFDQNSVRLG